VGFAPAQAGDEVGPGVFGLDAVAEPVRAPGRAGLVRQCVGEPGGVLALGVALGGVASGDLLGQVLGEVADAPGGVLGSGEHALGVELGSEPSHVAGLVSRADVVKAAPLRCAAARSAPRSGLRPRSRGRARLVPGGPLFSDGSSPPSEYPASARTRRGRCAPPPAMAFGHPRQNPAESRRAWAAIGDGAKCAYCARDSRSSEVRLIACRPEDSCSAIPPELGVR
jgi:hypothetical protein